jgi:RNA recognition motif-containing protein
MGTPEEAQKAVEAMNGAMLDGRNLTVNLARPKEERFSSGGGGARGPRREFSGRRNRY